jgi:hypothetical protein
MSTSVHINQSRAVVSPPPTIFRADIRLVGGQGGGQNSARWLGPDLDHPGTTDQAATVLNCSNSHILPAMRRDTADAMDQTFGNGR